MQTSAGGLPGPGTVCELTGICRRQSATNHLPKLYTPHGRHAEELVTYKAKASAKKFFCFFTRKKLLLPLVSQGS